MNRLVIYLIVLYFAAGCAKEEISELQSDYFIKFYGNYLEDTGNDIEESDDGQYIVTGFVENESTGKDILLMKLDEFGNKVDWEEKYFDFGDDDEGCRVKKLTDGYLIAGSITNDNGDKDAILIKTDFTGNRIATDYVYSYTGDEVAMDIAERYDGGYFMVGYSLNPTTGNKRFFIVGLDENLQNPVTSPPTQGELLRVVPNGTNGYIAFGNQFSGENNSESQFFIIEFDNAGNIFNVAFIGSADVREELTDIAVQNTNTIFLTGTATDPGTGQSRVMVTKFEDFSEQWSRFISSESNLHAKSIVLKQDGNLVVGADKVNNTDTNILVSFLNSQGNVTDSHEYGKSGDQRVEDLYISGGELLILGSNSYEENSMISLIKADENGNLWE